MSVLTAVSAYVNYDRWVADCPYCPGAEQVWPEGLRTQEGIPYPFGIFNSTLFCGWTGKKADVFFPAAAPEIMGILRRRPLKRNRNWMPHETVSDLIDENRKYGVD